MTITKSQVNKAIQNTGLEIFKTEGCYYFLPLPGSNLLILGNVESLIPCVTRLSDMTLEEWVREANSKREEILKEMEYYKS